MNSLKYVRPGKNYIPKFPIFQKCDVNGAKTHPLFEFLKTTLPTPVDDTVSLMKDSQSVIWSPVCRYDITWNFEKFLIGKDGVPLKRFSRYYETKNIAPDIKQLLTK